MALFSEYRAQEWDNRRLWLAVALSLLLHGLIAVLLLVEPWTWRLQPEPPPILAEFVLPPPPKPEPKAEAAKPPPAPEPPKAEAPPAPPLPPPSVPQLQRAPVTKESKAPPSAGDRARERPQASEAPKPAPPQPERRGPATATTPQQRPPQAQSQAGSRQPGAGRAAGAPAEVMTQSESDFFLSQIVPGWVIDFDSPRFKDIRIYGRYMVLPNGMLAPPFGKNDPWDLNTMIDGWDQIAYDPRPQAAAMRTAMETFLRAMRLAQPFAMPPDAQGYPKVLSLNFKIGDL